MTEPTLSKFPSARFKIFVDYQMLTISPISGWGKGNVAQNYDNFTGGKEEKICCMTRGLSMYFPSLRKPANANVQKHAKKG